MAVPDLDRRSEVAPSSVSCVLQSDPEALRRSYCRTWMIAVVPVRCTRSGQKEGDHNVHTLGFGSGRTGAGPGRLAEVCGGVAEVQVLEPGSSPTSGTVFPLFKGLGRL